jgi:aryl-alcohol dehydrogenase-like predicted oxidoreductase
MLSRRDVLKSAAASPLLTGVALADAPMPMATLGKSGLRVSRFCLGGYHMAVHGADAGVRIVQRALELGVTFFDSAWHYNKGASDQVYGRAISPALRPKVLLMSKAHFYEADRAMKQLEDTLKRMNTDYLDLWQVHQVSTMEEAERVLGPKGSLETFMKAKQQGKVRHIGFTGHRDPAVHQKLLAAYDGWETVQHPVNLVDPHYLSFIQNVLPKARARGLGVIAMKSNAMGSIGKNGVATIPQCLRFAWSQDVDTVVSGVETVEQLQQNVAVCKSFKPMSREELSTLLARTRQGQYGSKIENYKKPESGAAFATHDDAMRAEV